jgi:hypothetical protein
MSTPFYPGSSLTAEALDNLAPQVLQVEVDTAPISTTPTVLLTANVAETTYLVEGMLSCVIGATGTAPKIGFYGTAAESLMMIAYTMTEESTNGQSVYAARLTAMSSNTAQTAAIGGSGDSVQVGFRGTVTFSAAGTFILEAGLTTSGDSYTVKAGSYMIVQQAQS